MIPAPKFDRAIGMEYYFTDADGCGGVIRQNPEDFRVEEVYEEKG